MATNYAKHVSTRSTPQSEKAKPGQEQNHAGGFSFVLDKWARLDRWLILGAEGGSYYASERAMTKDNAKTVMECLDEDGARTVARIVEMSDSGRAPKNDPAIFALAMAAGHDNVDTRRAALAALPKVARIGTHLFHFARDVESFRKWGRGLRNAIAAWYNDKPADKLAYQVVKYQSRDGWSHRDLLRLSHAVAKDVEHDALFRWIVSGYEGTGEREIKRRMSDKSERIVKYDPIKEASLPMLVRDFERLKAATDAKEVVSILKANDSLSHEMLPTQWKNEKAVWEVLLPHMPLTAMVRNLAKMTAVGLLGPMNDATKHVVAEVTNADRLRKARVHPIALLSALRVYKQGHGERGKLSWTPVREVVDALDESFYLAFKAIEPTGKNHLLALDVSGSMGAGDIAGVPGLTPRDASAAMAMVTAKTEKNYAVVGFTSAGHSSRAYGGMWGGGEAGISTIDISHKKRLDDVIATVSGLPFGGTDCALPMIWALQNKVEVDTFVIYTDSETWAGAVHPFQALRDYRNKMGRASKLIVVGMTASDFTIADPSDAGMLDVVGFDTAAPSVMADVARM
jgi:60 kDa SS-A/Ro ribonucleoprotein